MGVAPPGEHGMSDKVRLYVVHLAPHVETPHVVLYARRPRSCSTAQEEGVLHRSTELLNTRAHIFFPRAARHLHAKQPLIL